MEKLFSLKILLKMAGGGMQPSHTLSESTPDNGDYYQLIRGQFSSTARENKLFLFNDSAT